MAAYKRFIAYVYEYQKDKKGGNRGFLKVESRNGVCTIELHIRGACSGDGVPCKIYGYVRRQGKMLGILLGLCTGQDMHTECVLTLDDKNMGGQGYTLEDLGGMLLLGEDGSVYGTEWDDEPIKPSLFEPLKVPEETMSDREAPGEAHRQQESNEGENEKGTAENGGQQESVDSAVEKGMRREPVLSEENPQEVEEAERDGQEDTDKVSSEAAPDLVMEEAAQNGFDVIPKEEENGLGAIPEAADEMDTGEWNGSSEDAGEDEWNQRPEGIGGQNGLPQEPARDGWNEVPEEMGGEDRNQMPEEVGGDGRNQMSGGMDSEGRNGMPEEVDRAGQSQIPEGSGRMGQNQMPREMGRGGQNQMPRETGRGGQSQMPGGMDRIGWDQMPEEADREGRDQMPEEADREGWNQMPEEVGRAGQRQMPEGSGRIGRNQMPEEAGGDESSQMPSEIERERWNQPPEEIIRGSQNEASEGVNSDTSAPEMQGRGSGFQNIVQLRMGNGMRNTLPETAGREGPNVKQDSGDPEEAFWNRSSKAEEEGGQNNGIREEKGRIPDTSVSRGNGESAAETGRNPAVEMESRQPVRKPQERKVHRPQGQRMRWEQFCPFDDGEITDCIKISPRDLTHLNKRDWGLGSNNFLLHGFYTFGHILVGRIEGKNQWILAVPGVYDRQEKFMAGMLGFPYFKAARKKGYPAGKYGYWYRLINPPDFYA